MRGSGGMTRRFLDGVVPPILWELCQIHGRVVSLENAAVWVHLWEVEINLTERRLSVESCLQDNNRGFLQLFLSRGHKYLPCIPNPWFCLVNPQNPKLFDVQGGWSSMED